jgi:hypothetical protein
MIRDLGCRQIIIGNAQGEEERELELVPDILSGGFDHDAVCSIRLASSDVTTIYWFKTTK